MADDRFSGAFGPEQHLDLQADLHYFFDTLVTGKMVLDVGAGRGRSKVRIRHNRVTTYEPSEHCRDVVDVCGPMRLPDLGTFDVVTAFEVLEHVQDDEGFLHDLNHHARQAVFLTTPASHADRLRALVRRVWEFRVKRWFSFCKDAEGGWCELIDEDEPVERKLLVLISKDLAEHELVRIDIMYAGRTRALSPARSTIQGGRRA